MMPGSTHDVELQPPENGPPESEKSRSKVRLFAIMVALNLCLFVAALDASIVATSIPTISSELHSASGYVWIGGAYLLANAAAAPIWAKISDIFGRKPILLSAVAGFFGSSIICATASSMEMLIVGRTLQGTAGGGLVQMVNITISDLFSMRLRSLYLGMLEFMWAIAGGVGPILGGTFTELVTWRWSFWINLPISGTTFLLLFFFLDVHNPRTKMADGLKAVDWYGCVCMLGLVLMLLLGLDFGGTIFPWSSPKVICLIVFGAFMSVLFVVSEKKLAAYPLMPLRMFNHGSNVASLLLCFFQGFVFIAAEFYLPLYFQSVKGASPLRSGVLVIPLTITQAVSGIIAGVVIHRTGRYRELIWLGTLLLTLGNGLYVSLSATASLARIVGVQMVAGLGSGLLFEPPLISLQALVAQDDTATATATLGTVRNVAMSASLVVGGVLFQNGMTLRAGDLRVAGLAPALAGKLAGDQAAANVDVVSRIGDPAQRRAVREAFAWSLRNLWILYTVVAFGGVVAGAFIVGQDLSKEHVETKTGIKKSDEVHASDAQVELDDPHELTLCGPETRDGAV